jgi:hypothetical protein
LTAAAATHRVEAFFRRLGDDIAATLGDTRESVYAGLERVAAEKLAAHNPSAHVSPADLVARGRRRNRTSARSPATSS